MDRIYDRRTREGPPPPITRQPIPGPRDESRIRCDGDARLVFGGCTSARSRPTRGGSFSRGRRTRSQARCARRRPDGVGVQRSEVFSEHWWAERPKKKYVSERCTPEVEGKCKRLYAVHPTSANLRATDNGPTAGVTEAGATSRSFANGYWWASAFGMDLASCSQTNARSWRRPVHGGGHLKVRARAPRPHVLDIDEESGANGNFEGLPRRLEASKEAGKPKQYLGTLFIAPVIPG